MPVLSSLKPVTPGIDSVCVPTAEGSADGWAVRRGRSRAVVATLVCALLCACGSKPLDENSTEAIEKLYSEAKQDIASGSYDRATKTLERVEGKAAGTLLSQQASLDLAYVQYKTGERVQATSTLDRFIKLNPSSAALDYAFYLKGLVNFNDDLGIFGRISKQDLSERDQQASRDAYQAFKQLVDQFPGSRYAPDAKLRMNYIVNSLADYELHVARYYFSRGAYVAAANRAQSAVQEFQQAPSTEEALYIMMAAYERLGLTTLRDDTERVLRKNFPESGFLRNGMKSKDKAWWRIW